MLFSSWKWNIDNDNNWLLLIQIIRTYSLIWISYKMEHDVIGKDFIKVCRITFSHEFLSKYHTDLSISILKCKIEATEMHKKCNFHYTHKWKIISLCKYGTWKVSINKSYITTWYIYIYIHYLLTFTSWNSAKHLGFRFENHSPNNICLFTMTRWMLRCYKNEWKNSYKNLSYCKSTCHIHLFQLCTETSGNTIEIAHAISK